MATVHPYKGYLNTKFHLYAKGTQDVSFSIFLVRNEGEKPVLNGTFTPNVPYEFNLNGQGKYRIEFNDGTSSEIIVEDGYKLGGSEYKRSFIFDETPWCFVIMNDRTYFYNRKTEESYLETISPDYIKPISPDYVIFENTGQEERTIYSLNEQKPILNISNIIFHNDEVVLWKEIYDERCINIIFYSLPERAIVKNICVDDYIIDNEKETIIYQTENILQKQELTLPLRKEQTINTCGQITSLVAPYIAITIDDLSYSSNICVIDVRKNEILSRINVDDVIASINSKSLIDINEHINKIKSIDYDLIGCEGVKLKATYLSYHFYPTKWDVFYIIRERTFERAFRHINNNKYTYKIKSLATGEEYAFDNDISNVIIKEHIICFLNYKESLIFGEKIKSEYSKDVTTYTHINDVLRSSAGKIDVLEDFKGWRPLEIQNCSLRYFDDFGLIKNDDDDSYIDLSGHTYTGLPFVNYLPVKYLTIKDKIILLSGEVLPAIKASITHSGEFCLIQEKEGIYLDSNTRGTITRKRILTDLYDASSYRSVLLSEDGSKILYRDEKQGIILDLQSNTSDRYDNVSYIKDINGIRPLFSHRPGALQPRLVNPVTGQILPHDRMSAYQFISPDGLLYADTDIDKYVETWNLITNELLTADEISEFADNLFYVCDSESEKSKKNRKNRQIFVEKNLKFFKETCLKQDWKERSDKEWVKAMLGLPYYEFAKIFIERRGVAYIRNKKDDSVIAKIALGDPLWFLNYVSFSYDNRFVAIAGRYQNDSNFGGLFLVYDLIRKKEVIAKRNSWAVWMTSFNRKNQVAAYSSEPISYDSILSCTESYECVNSHPNFSFLTFSPDGEFAALSNQGYISKFDRNGNERDEWGHMPSCEVFVVKSEDMDSPLFNYSDLSDSGIDGLSDIHHNCSKTVSSVSFSNDNKRLMMVGNDGVVIIRNLYLDSYAGK